MDLDAGGIYRPKTRETQAAYETLLSLVQDKLGDYATDVIAGAADEVLGILKSGHLKAGPSSRNTSNTCSPRFAGPWSHKSGHNYSALSRDNFGSCRSVPHPYLK